MVYAAVWLTVSCAGRDKALWSCMGCRWPYVQDAVQVELLLVEWCIIEMGMERTT